MGELSNFGGIFPTAAMIAHDCIPNAGHFENMDDGSLEIVSVQDIPTGTPITMCYDSCLKVRKSSELMKLFEQELYVYFNLVHQMTIYSPPQ